MRDPVITPSGITYDKKDIEEHLQVDWSVLYKTEFKGTHTISKKIEIRPGPKER